MNFSNDPHPEPEWLKIRAEKILSEYRFNLESENSRRNTTDASFMGLLVKWCLLGPHFTYRCKLSQFPNRHFDAHLRPISIRKMSRKKKNEIENLAESSLHLNARKKVYKWKLQWHKTTYQFNLGACFVKYRRKNERDKLFAIWSRATANNRV